jgi:hypothetical protein
MFIVLRYEIVQESIGLGDWRVKALEHFPDLQELIEQASGPMGLWIELHGLFLNAYDEPIDLERIGKVYDFARWCFEQPATGDVETDLSNAAAVAFVENIPLDKRVSDDLYRWMSAQSFDSFEELFRYHLSDEEYRRFAADFHQKKKQFDGPSRL